MLRRFFVRDTSCPRTGDLSIHINPTDERTAMDELTTKITQFEAQLETELEKGSNRNITRLRTQIDDLYEERRKAETMKVLPEPAVPKTVVFPLFSSRRL